MSGHSKWATIRRAKAVKDNAKGKVFTKLAKAITLAAQSGGSDMNTNFILRMAVDRARTANMPSDNIERAVKKGTGEIAGERQIIKIIYEGYAPGQVGVLIECQTDNSNRSLTEVRTLVDRNGGRLTPPGSISWQFEEKGLILMQPKKLQVSTKFGKEGEFISIDAEEVLLDILDIAGVDDVSVIDEDGVAKIEVITVRDSLREVNKQIVDRGYKVDDVQLAQLPKETIQIDEQAMDTLMNFIEAVEESDEVINIWHNARS